MTKKTRTPPPTESAEIRSVTSSPSLSSPEAKRRRKALRDFLTRRGLTATDLSRSIGLPSPNALFNHLSGHSASLSVDTIERIALAYPDASFAEILGLPAREGPPPAPSRSEWPTPNVVVSTVVQAGNWRRSFSVRPERWMLLPLPQIFGPIGAGAFGAWVHEPGDELFYPAGTILICRRVSAGQTHPAGRRLIVARHRGARQEVTVRELVEQEGVHVLRSGTGNAGHREDIPMPAPPETEMTLSIGERIEIVGYVIASVQWEEPLPLP